MKLKLVVVGKTDDPQLEKLIGTYERRLSHYLKFEIVVIPTIKNAKNLSEEEQKLKEGNLILPTLTTSDFVALLDEKGGQFTSKEFSNYLQKRMNSGIKNLVFVVGGPYGFSQPVYERGNDKISLSKMTFSHQMVRLFAVEQLYRAFTILKNEPYHHE